MQTVTTREKEEPKYFSKVPLMIEKKVEVMDYHSGEEVARRRRRY
jgi:hypothetical protein